MQTRELIEQPGELFVFSSCRWTAQRPLEHDVDSFGRITMSGRDEALPPGIGLADDERVIEHGQGLGGDVRAVPASFDDLAAGGVEDRQESRGLHQVGLDVEAAAAVAALASFASPRRGYVDRSSGGTTKRLRDPSVRRHGIHDEDYSRQEILAKRGKTSTEQEKEKKGKDKEEQYERSFWGLRATAALLHHCLHGVG